MVVMGSVNSSSPQGISWWRQWVLLQEMHVGGTPDLGRTIRGANTVIKERCHTADATNTCSRWGFIAYLQTGFITSGMVVTAYTSQCLKTVIISSEKKSVLTYLRRFRKKYQEKLQLFVSISHQIAKCINISTDFSHKDFRRRSY